jgi:hypothetical protein
MRKRERRRKRPLRLQQKNSQQALRWCQIKIRVEQEASPDRQVEAQIEVVMAAKDTTEVEVKAIFLLPVLNLQMALRRTKTDLETEATLADRAETGVTVS